MYLSNINLLFLKSLRLCSKPCGHDDESINHKVHLLVESSLNTLLIQTIVVSSFEFGMLLVGITSCLLLWKASSANISRSLFIKLSVYSIKFVIIKTFIKKIFVSTLPTIDQPFNEKLIGNWGRSEKQVTNHLLLNIESHIMQPHHNIYYSINCRMR